MLPTVQAAPRSDICRWSTADGSSPAGVGGAGPLATGLKRAASVTGLTQIARPSAKLRAVATVVPCAVTFSMIDRSSDECTRGSIANVRASSSSVAGRDRFSSAKSPSVPPATTGALPPPGDPLTHRSGEPAGRAWCSCGGVVEHEPAGDRRSSHRARRRRSRARGLAPPRQTAGTARPRVHSRPDPLAGPLRPAAPPTRDAPDARRPAGGRGATDAGVLLARGQGRSVTGRPQSHARQAPPGRRAERDRRPFGRGTRAGRASRFVDSDRHALLEPLARLGPKRAREADRRAVRLERCVGPVALVLGLEEVAREHEPGSGSRLPRRAAARRTPGSAAARRRPRSSGGR